MRDFLKELPLSGHETRKLLRGAIWRERTCGGIEIKYKRRWRHLCRTDLLNDIRTWYEGANSPNCYLQKAVLGARVTKNAFFVVDALTDG